MLEQTQEMYKASIIHMVKSWWNQKAYSHQKEWVGYLESMEMAK